MDNNFGTWHYVKILQPASTVSMCDGHCYCSLFVMNISSILMVPRVVIVARIVILTMELIRARQLVMG